MGKGKVLFTSAIFSAFVIALLANSFSAQASGNCQSKLVGKTYNCTGVQEGYGSLGDFTVEFETGGWSQYFDLVFSEGADYGCSCESSGSVDSPKYDSSSSTFVCEEAATGFGITGKASGKKIKAQAVNGDGATALIFCTQE
ncbi:MAG: hypothetical protein ABSB13_14130 [Candidatus Binatus sp.]|jgi:hypothetical protein|uniref:hypothetical protein n=1 Tax=Candidatus Binatus sp. TaxID=2811406 RepID=UPI003D12633E